MVAAVVVLVFAVVWWAIVPVPAAEMALRASESARRTGEAERARLAAAVEQSPDAIVITDTAGTIEYANPAFERITGYARAGAVASITTRSTSTALP